MDSERRQGGPGWWRAWWWLVTWNPRRFGSPIKDQVIPAAIMTISAVILLCSGAPPGFIPAEILLLALAVSLAHPGPWRSAPRVTARSQPDLYCLVEGVAGHLGAPMPDRVLLDHSGGVRSVASGFRRDLRIGLHALSVLNRTQVEALVAHELSPLRYRHSWLVLRLRSLRPAEMFAPGARMVQREGMLAQLFEFWSMVEDDSDAAAVAFGGAGCAADAVVVAGFGWAEYLGYLLEERAPRDRERVQDLDDGWRRYLAHSHIHTAEFDYEEEASEHTILGDAIRRLGQVRVQLVEGRVDVAPLSEPEQRWLARRSPWQMDLAIRLGLRRIRWYTFASAPAHWWVARAERDMEFMRTFHKIPSEADVVEALAGTDDERDGLQLYAEYQLLKSGWRFEHPAVRGVLLSPAGDRVDLSTMDRPAVTAILA